jgi:hypothetical protein
MSSNDSTSTDWTQTPALREYNGQLHSMVKTVIREIELLHKISPKAATMSNVGVPEVRSIYIAKTNYGDEKGSIKLTVSMTDTEFTWEG